MYLENSNLSNVNLANANLNNSMFYYTNFQLVDFSKMPDLRGHSDRVNSVAFSPDRKILASGSKDASIKIWKLETGAQI